MVANETALILSQSTARSLVILDEVGRETSTYDGLSIAWAVVEHLHRDPERGPRTLFATHYQELTQLEKHLPRLRNYSVAVKEWNDDNVFLRRVVPGPADRSYGIQVARLAKLESDDTSISLPAPQAKPKKKITIAPADDSQLGRRNHPAPARETPDDRSRHRVLVRPGTWRLRTKGSASAMGRAREPHGTS